MVTCSKHAGFTLMELICVLACLSVITVAINQRLLDQRNETQSIEIGNRWRAQARSALDLIAQEARQSPVPPRWADGELRTTGTGSSSQVAVYRLADVDDLTCLVREDFQDGAVQQQTVLATHVNEFNVIPGISGLDVVLHFGAQIERFHPQATHQTHVALPLYASQVGGR